MKLSLKPQKLSSSEEREVITNIFGEETEYNKFYNIVSSSYRIIEFVLFAAALIFIVAYTALNADDVTYSRFEYIAKNITYDVVKNTSSRSYISYLPDDNIMFKKLGDGIAVARQDSIAIYSSTGVKTSDRITGYKDPTVVGSDRLLLVFEQGKNEFKLYSMFSEVMTSTVEYPIFGACVGNDGSFALISQTRDLSSNIYLYNKKLKLINIIKKNEFVTSVAISDDGSEVISSSFETNEKGELVAYISKYRSGTEEKEVLMPQNGLLPIKCCYTDSGFSVICDSGLLFYESNGNLIKRIDFIENVSYCDMSDKAILTVKNIGSSHRLIEMNLYDSRGELLFGDTADGTALGISCYGKSGFVLTENNVFCLQDKMLSKGIGDMSMSYNDRIIAVSEDEAFVCTKSRTLIMKFTNN